MLAEQTEPELLRREELLLTVEIANPTLDVSPLLIRFRSVLVVTAAEGRTLALVLMVVEAPKASVTRTNTTIVRFVARDPVGRRLVVELEAEVIPRGKATVAFERA